ncbi:hypothetical protein [Saccharopolyspora endophytica]|nr:hypothetical protein [Saccharopolyspora endophytica]
MATPFDTTGTAREQGLQIRARLTSTDIQDDDHKRRSQPIS